MSSSKTEKYICMFLIFMICLGMTFSQNTNAAVLPYGCLTDSQFINNKLDNMWNLNNGGTGWTESFDSNGLTFRRETTLPTSGGNRQYMVYNGSSINNKTIVSSGVYVVEIKMKAKVTDVAGQTADLYIAFTNPSQASSLGEKRNYSFSISNNKVNLRNSPNNKGVNLSTENLSTYRFVFDFAARTTEVYINGTKEVTGYSFIGPNVNSFEAIEILGRQIVANDYVTIKSIKGWYDSQILFDQETSTLTADGLTNQDATKICENLTLPTSLGEHIGVYWESSDSSVISNTGVVTQDKNANKDVILTATLQATGADGVALRTTKRFNFTVLTEKAVILYQLLRYDFSDNSQLSQWQNVLEGGNVEIDNGRLKIDRKNAEGELKANFDIINAIKNDALLNALTYNRDIYVSFDIYYSGTAVGNKATFQIMSANGDNLLDNTIENINGSSQKASISYGDAPIDSKITDAVLVSSVDTGSCISYEFGVNTTTKEFNVSCNTNSLEKAYSLSNYGNIGKLQFAIPQSMNTTNNSLYLDNFCISVVDNQRLDILQDNLIDSFISSQSLTGVNEDLTLRTVFPMDIMGEWTSSNPTAVDEKGNIKLSDVENTATLTGKFYYKSKPSTYIIKEYDVTVAKYNKKNLAFKKDVTTKFKEKTGYSKGFITDGKMLSSYVTNGLQDTDQPELVIDLQESNYVSKVMVYEQPINASYNIKNLSVFTSSNGKDWTLAASGSGSGEDAAVLNIPFVSVRYLKLKVTDKKSGDIGFKEIEVYFELTDDFAVSEDTKELIIEDAADYIINASKIKLPQEGSKYGSDIAWSSSHPEVIALTGEITKPNYHTVVTLTAKITKGKAWNEKVFNYLIEGTKQTTDTVKGSGSSGSKGSVNSSDIVVYSHDSENRIDPPVNTSYFTDLDEVSWAKEYVNKLYNLKIISGVSDGKFEPNRKINREEFIKMLVTAFDMDANGQNEGDLSFEDVLQEDWFYPYIRVATSQGIIKGVGNNTFGTGTQILRQDAALLLYRVLLHGNDRIKTEKTALFNDNQEISSYAKEAIEALGSAGIFSGNENNEIQPLQNITRGQAAKIICLSMDLLRR